MAVGNAYSKANLCQHLKNAAFEIPNLLAVAVQKHQNNQLTYKEIDFITLDKKSDAIAFALNAYGIKRGMKAVLMVTPSIDFFALTFALFKAGIVPILVDPGMGVKNLKQCFIESSPDVFIGVPKAHIARILFGWGKKSIQFLLTVSESKLSNLFIGGLNLSNLKRKFSSSQPYPMELLHDDEMAAILFTSGSTGVPKGVVYSHKMFEAQIEILKNDYGICKGEKDLATFPLFSLFGPALGMASIIPDMDASKPIKANPDFIFSAIEKYQCTNLFANPALIEVLGKAGVDRQEKHFLPSLKRVISAGAPATLSSIKRFIKMLNPGVEIMTSYGATESLPLTKIGSKYLLTTEDVTSHGGGICVGTPVTSVDIAIIDITDNAIALWNDSLKIPDGNIGEIVVKGSMVSHAYYHRESATTLAKIYDEKALWHRMGDLGYFDSQGKLWMCGRKSHRVEMDKKVFFSISCERIFNIHSLVNRTALVGVKIKGKVTPFICIELESDINKSVMNFEEQLFKELKVIALKQPQTFEIEHFAIHPKFPVDIRHNAKINREKLTDWAQRKIY